MSSLTESFSKAVKPITEGVFAIGIGLFVGALLMLVWGFDPLRAYLELFRGAFFGKFQMATTLSYATPYILTGITFAIGQRAGLFNIGGEGQVYMGAIAAVAAGTYALPTSVHLLVTVIFSMLAGAAWALPPAVLKVTRGVHEVVSTVMLNWTCVFLCRYLAMGPLVDPNSAEKTISVLPSSRFPILLSGSELTAAIFASVVFAVVVYIILWHTAIGYEIRAVGLNPDAARYGGISPLRSTILAFMLGGFAAGLAGASQVIGRPPTWAIYGTLANITNLGFDGIAVALIGRNHPLGAIIAAIFFGGLYTGSRYMQMYARVPVEIVRALHGIIILAVAIPGLLDIIKKWWEKRRGK